MLHHIDDVTWVHRHKLTLVKLSFALGVRSEMLRQALDSTDADLEGVLYHVGPVSGIERLIIYYPDSTMVTLDSE